MWIRWADQSSAKTSDTSQHHGIGVNLWKHSSILELLLIISINKYIALTGCAIFLYIVSLVILPFLVTSEQCETIAFLCAPSLILAIICSLCMMIYENYISIFLHLIQKITKKKYSP
jgi:hypothetical protein